MKSYSDFTPGWCIAYTLNNLNTKLHSYSADGDTSTTIILCRAHVEASGRYVPGTCGRIGSTGLKRPIYGTPAEYGLNNKLKVYCFIRLTYYS